MLVYPEQHQFEYRPLFRQLLLHRIAGIHRNIQQSASKHFRLRQQHKLAQSFICFLADKTCWPNSRVSFLVVSRSTVTYKVREEEKKNISKTNFYSEATIVLVWIPNVNNKKAKPVFIGHNLNANVFSGVTSTIHSAFVTAREELKQQ